MKKNEWEENKSTLSAGGNDKKATKRRDKCSPKWERAQQRAQQVNLSGGESIENHETVSGTAAAAVPSITDRLWPPPVFKGKKPKNLVPKLPPHKERESGINKFARLHTLAAHPLTQSEFKFSFVCYNKNRKGKGWKNTEHGGGGGNQWWGKINWESTRRGGKRFSHQEKGRERAN